MSHIELLIWFGSHILLCPLLLLGQHYGCPSICIVTTRHFTTPRWLQSAQNDFIVLLFQSLHSDQLTGNGRPRPHPRPSAPMPMGFGWAWVQYFLHGWAWIPYYNGWAWVCERQPAIVNDLLFVRSNQELVQAVNAHYTIFEYMGAI